MTTVDINLSAYVAASSRVEQVGAMFDVPREDKQSFHARVGLDLDARDWSIGLVVGPSGSGKSSLARKVWPEQMNTTLEWDDNAALVDGFDADMSIRDVTSLLSAVGLASPPAWLRPHRTLSNGEMFRADVARALADTPGGGTCVIDEFTSVVDRQVAQVASHAIQKTVRRRGVKFVGVSCHYDIVDWLQPDWIVDMRDASFAWRSVQPHPRLELAVHPASRSDWGMFARHHYLSAELAGSAKCFLAWLDDTPVAFTSYRHFPHPKTRNLKLAHRLVVLPDYQGVGIAKALADWMGQYLWDRRYRLRFNVAHPAMVGMFRTSPRWREHTYTTTKLHASSKHKHLLRGHSQVRTLNLRSFEYVSPV